MSKKKNEMKKRNKMVQAHTHTHIKKKQIKVYEFGSTRSICIYFEKNPQKKVTFEIGILYVY